MEHRTLLDDISWFTQGVAKGPVQIQEMRRVSRNGPFLHESQSYRRHAAGFDFPCEQSHGPRADRSGGHQKSQIDVRLADAPCDFFDRGHKPRGAAHQAETVVILGQTSNDVLGLKLPQTLDRKYQVDVLELVRSVVGLV
jgi:hypothetical protein